MLKLLILLSFLAFIYCDFAKWGRKSSFTFDYQPKKYTINLDLPYYQRWYQLLTENKKEIQDIINLALFLYGPHETQGITYELIQQYNKDVAEEMKVFSELLDVPIGHVLILNVMYEAYSFCSSVVIQDSQNNVYQGRNLDYGISSIGKVSFNVDFYKNERLLYKAYVFGGFLGHNVVEKPGKFSISANQRASSYVNENDKWEITLGRTTNLFEMFYNKRFGMLLSIRQVAEKAENYEEAVKMLTNTPLLAPVYFIVSGVNHNEGCILTMNRDGLESMESLNIEKGVWYLVQTNYDREVIDPVFDDRRSVAEEKVRRIGREKITKEVLSEEVMLMYPNFHRITIATAMMDSKEGVLDITLWG